MRTAEALAVLKSARPDLEQTSSEVGTRADIAFLRLSRRDSPAKWAVVSTPGDRWFSLDVDGGYSYDHAEEDAPHEEARHIIEQLVELAAQYIRQAPTAVRSGRFGLWSIKLPTPAGDILLRKSLVGSLVDVLTSMPRFRR